MREYVVGQLLYVEGFDAWVYGGIAELLFDSEELVEFDKNNEYIYQ